MISQKFFEQIEENLDTVLNQDSVLGKDLWQEFLNQHPADIAQFFGSIERELFGQFFLKLDLKHKLEIFEYLNPACMVYALDNLGDKERAELLENLPLDELNDLFDHFTDDQIKQYFGLLRKKDREKLLSLMQFSHQSAGGIMEIEVVTLKDYFTVARSIALLQRLAPSKELYQVLYVTDNNNRLVGFINLEDLVLNKSMVKISDFLKQNELVIQVDEDQEEIAKKMRHYHIMSVPVVGDNEYFLGVITNETLVDILEEEASEDVYKISAMSPIKNTYFETPFSKLFFERSSILVLLLLVGSFSSSILHAFEIILAKLMFLTPMLTSTGGNTSSQTSALAIQGIASGEINSNTIDKFLKKEIQMAAALGSLLAVTAFLRVFFTGKSISFWESVAVSLSLGLIVMVSVVLGSLLPLGLKKIGLDPAFAAGPFLGTIMDILGTLIFCYMVSFIIG